MANYDGFCGLTQEGRPVCWGLPVDFAAELGGAHESIDAMALGDYHACFLFHDAARVRCIGMGATSDRNVRFGGKEHRSEPLTSLFGQSIAPPGELCSVHANADTSCGVTPEGNVTCWGKKPLSESTSVLPGARSIAVGNSSVCAVVDGKNVRCWATVGFQGHHGKAPFSDLHYFVRGVPEAAIDVAVADHAVFVLTANALYGAPVENDVEAVRLRRADGAQELAASESYLCLSSSSAPRCWPLDVTAIPGVY